ncbi:hypothetical protein AO275_15865 [Pseudomonas viridiflava]|nr:hypothetical protein AO275_15865 [Pseudomonas viridiflava]
MLAWLTFCRMSIGNRSFRAHGGNNAYIISQAQSLCARFAFIVSFPRLMVREQLLSLQSGGIFQERSMACVMQR